MDAHKKLNELWETIESNFTTADDGLICPMECLQKVVLEVHVAISELMNNKSDCALPGTNNCHECRNKALTAPAEELLGFNK